MTDKQYLIKDSQIDALINAVADKLGHSNAKKWKSDLLQSLPVMESEPVTNESLLGAVGRAWCYPCNAHKTMDADLALAMCTEVSKLYTSPQALTALPEPIFTKVADGIELGHNLWGGIAIRLGGEFTYVQVNYNHEYTDNATRARLADNIVKLIQGEVPHPQALKQITADDVTGEMLEAVKKAIPMQGVVTREKVVAIYNAVIKNWSEAR